jgi:hypothetical protein
MARPILMSAPMVRALLDGRKTQTRRVCKNADVIEAAESEPWCEPVLERAASRTGPASIGRRLVGSMCRVQDGFRLADAIDAFCPYGRPGDLLWVREAFTYVEEPPDGEDFLVYEADGGRRSLGEWRHPHPIYDHCVGRFGQAIPSTHMPRWASRLTLEITGVRLERLQDLTDEDAKAEGLKAVTKGGTLFKYGIPDADGLPGSDDHGWPWRVWNHDPRLAFRLLWEQIHGVNSWNSNPWVWALTFRVHQRNVDRMAAAA